MILARIAILFFACTDILSLMSETLMFIPETERQTSYQILTDLFPYLSGNWVMVGGLPMCYYASLHHETYPYKFNDFDIAASDSAVLLPEVSRAFFIYHHHQQGSTKFYFQLGHKQFPEIHIDIFCPAPEQTNEITVLDRSILIPTPEEMFLYKLRDIDLLLDSPRGLPPKHLEQLRILEKTYNNELATKLWNERHINQLDYLPIYSRFQSLQEAIETIKDKIKIKSGNIKDWTKSNPLTECRECVHYNNFQLYRDGFNTTSSSPRGNAKK